jgi:hypothetical protein
MSSGSQTQRSKSQSLAALVIISRGDDKYEGVWGNCRFIRDEENLAFSQIVISYCFSLTFKFDVQFDWLAVKTIECIQSPLSSTHALIRLSDENESAKPVPKCEQYWLIVLQYSTSDLMTTEMPAPGQCGDGEARFNALHEYILPESRMKKLNEITVYICHPDPHQMIDDMWGDWQRKWKESPGCTRKSDYDDIVDTPQKEVKSEGQSYPCYFLPCFIDLCTDAFLFS